MATIGYVTKFQFHKGSINTWLAWAASISPKLFQFHKGSINTLVSFGGVLGLRCFNSIKVRLILP